MMSEESLIRMPPEEMKECKEKNGEEKQHVLPQMNLREHPQKEGLNGVVGKSTTKRTGLLRAYGKHLKNLR